jgi:hypothetical protein
MENNDKPKSKAELFLELAQPDSNGFSRVVHTSEFIGKYRHLIFGNGANWARKESALAKKYKLRFYKSGGETSGITGIQLTGFNDDASRQHINSAIKTALRNKHCVVLGTSNPEIDHKNGRKNDPRLYDTALQTADDFQPLSKAANDAKRQFCKECRNTNRRYDAKLLGYPLSFCRGGAEHDGTVNGCIGCFWFDPVEFRKHLTVKP